LRTCEANISVNKLRCTDGVFVSLSSFGVVEIASLDGENVKASAISKQIQERYTELVERNDLKRIGNIPSQSNFFLV
jgi:branched-subunit amino acid aminotransferase/4-amino-4-deoxychorismate lyase